MDAGHTTAAIQRYLDDLSGMSPQSPAETIIRDVLSEAARRLHLICATMLHRSYGRLSRPPLNLESEELLGAVVERLLKALRESRPKTVRQFFGLANQHMRWELNDLARRLDNRTPMVELPDAIAQSQQSSSGSVVSVNARRMLEAIENLPEEEREAFSLVRIQGLTHADAATVLSVSTKTVQRRLNRGRVLLVKLLEDLRPHEEAAGSA